MKSYLVSLLVLTFLFQTSSYCQNTRSVEERVKAKNDFTQKYNYNWEIRWNEKTATPYSLVGYKISKYKGTSQEIAKAFMREEKIMFGISSTDSNIALEKNNYSKSGGDRLLYKQIYGEPHLYLRSKGS